MAFMPLMENGGGGGFLLLIMMYIDEVFVA
jgi:hypothetical protein